MLAKEETKSTDYATLITNELFNKDKLGFRYAYGRLKKQAQHFSPSYRDFIYKVIKNSSLKIKSSTEGYFVENDTSERQSSLSKRRKAIVVTNLYNLDTLGHELGHAVDMWFGRHMALSHTVLIEGDKTLDDIFLKEFNAKHKELYDSVIDEYKSIIKTNINGSAFQILMDNFDKYRLLMDSDNTLSREERAKLQNELYKNGFVEAYYQLITKKCYAILNQKYGPILDALSAKYELDYFNLWHHDTSYYEIDKHHLVQEFFANLFAAKVTGKHEYIDYLIKYLPRSFSAFEKLFVIIYDHLQNNKRFTDVKIRKEVEKI